MIVGLTGGIGSGKSAVARIFERRGAVVIDADAIAREVVAAPSAVLESIRDAFGAEVINAAGGLDRARVAKIVFADEAKRRRLNELTHPEVRKRLLAQIDLFPPSAIVVVVVPLLFESGFDRECDTVVAVVAPEETRLARAAARDGGSEGDVRARMRSQLPDAEYEQRADFVIRNAGDEASLEREVDRAWSAIKSASEGNA